MTVKLTLIYANPLDPEEFERRYKEHKELVAQVPDLLRAEGRPPMWSPRVFSVQRARRNDS